MALLADPVFLPSAPTTRAPPDYLNLQDGEEWFEIQYAQGLVEFAVQRIRTSAGTTGVPYMARIFQTPNNGSVGEPAARFLKMPKSQFVFVQERIEREAVTLKSLLRGGCSSIPKYVQLYHKKISDAEDFYFIAMEHLIPCFAYLRDDVSKLFHFAYESVLGLMEIHQQQVIHGDIKPGNMTVRKEITEDGSIKFKPVYIDFDVAIPFGQTGSYVGQSPGTELFSSPRVMREFDGNVSITEWDDLVALGFTLLVMHVSYMRTIEDEITQERALQMKQIVPWDAIGQYHERHAEKQPTVGEHSAAKYDAYERTRELMEFDASLKKRCAEDGFVRRIVQIFRPLRELTLREENYWVLYDAFVDRIGQFLQIVLEKSNAVATNKYTKEVERAVDPPNYQELAEIFKIDGELPEIKEDGNAEEPVIVPFAGETLVTYTTVSDGQLSNVDDGKRGAARAKPDMTKLTFEDIERLLQEGKL